MWGGGGVQGKGHGQIRFKITYWPFDLLYSKPRKSTLVSWFRFIALPLLYIAKHVLKDPSPANKAFERGRGRCW